MAKYVGRVFDDRNPEVSIYKCSGPTYESVSEEVHSELDMYKDPDDGVMPSHLKYSIDKVEDKNA